jgi:hypothetical protein
MIKQKKTRTRSALIELRQFPLPLQNLGSGRTRRVKHDCDNRGVVCPQVLLVPAFDGAVHQSLRRVDPLPARRGVEHVLFVGLLGLTDVKNGLENK